MIFKRSYGRPQPVRLFLYANSICGSSADVIAVSDKQQLLSSRLQAALTNDKKFQALYITVLRIFHSYLAEDLKLLVKYKEENCFESDRVTATPPYISNLSFAAKWAPTPGKSADKQLHIATALALLFYPGDDVFWARHKLQKEILTPLRKVLAIPEVAMSNQSWKFDYNRVRFCSQTLLYD